MSTQIDRNEPLYKARQAGKRAKTIRNIIFFVSVPAVWALVAYLIIAEMIPDALFMFVLAVFFFVLTPILVIVIPAVVFASIALGAKNRSLSRKREKADRIFREQMKYKGYDVNDPESLELVKKDMKKVLYNEGAITDVEYNSDLVELENAGYVNSTRKVSNSANS